jgi:hypothetical protein
MAFASWPPIDQKPKDSRQSISSNINSGPVSDSKIHVDKIVFKSAKLKEK